MLFRRSDVADVRNRCVLPLGYILETEDCDVVGVVGAYEGNRIGLYNTSDVGGGTALHYVITNVSIIVAEAVLAPDLDLSADRKLLVRVADTPSPLSMSINGLLQRRRGTACGG